MAHLAGKAVGAANQTTAADYPRADPDSSREVDEVLGTGEFSKAKLGKHGEIGVTVHCDRIIWSAERTDEPVAQVDVAPSVVGCQPHRALRVDESRHANGQAEHPPPLSDKP